MLSTIPRQFQKVPVSSPGNGSYSTSIEPGSYLVRYDAKTGEITILDGKTVVATAKATVKTNDKSFANDALLTITTPMGRKLTGIRLGGQREEIMITDMSVE